MLNRRIKKEEATDVTTILVPSLYQQNGIPLENIKTDTSTGKTGIRRGDVLISLVSSSRGDSIFEKNIVAFIEAKHRNCVFGDADWRKAKKDGQEKALAPGVESRIKWTIFF